MLAIEIFVFSGQGFGSSKENILLLFLWGLELEIWASSWPPFSMTHNFCSTSKELRLAEIGLNFDLREWVDQNHRCENELDSVENVTQWTRPELGRGVVVYRPRSASHETPLPPGTREQATFTKCFCTWTVSSSHWALGPGGGSLWWGPSLQRRWQLTHSRDTAAVRQHAAGLCAPRVTQFQAPYPVTYEHYLLVLCKTAALFILIFLNREHVLNCND